MWQKIIKSNKGYIMQKIFSFLLIVVFISACSDGGNNAEIPQTDNTSGNTSKPINNIAIPDNRYANNYQVLLFGNSHVIGLSGLLKRLISAGNPFATITIKNAGGGFLDDSSSKQRRIELLESELWTHVILQGQKYSQSGAKTYPINAALAWIDKAKSHNTTPILFPEHPQKGKTQEGSRVHLIHTGIAELQKACVAPVGLAWDRVIMTYPQIVLHTDDGNHASLTGQLLSAFIFYEVITGEAADLLPFDSNIDVDEATQQILRQMASETIKTHPPCIFEK